MHYADWNPEEILRQQNISFHNTRIFALAFWKTINIQKSYKLIYFRKMLIALIFFPLASLYRGYFPPRVQNKVIYDAVEIDNLNKTYFELDKQNLTELPKKVYFAPPDKPFEEIIKLACSKLNLDGYTAVKDAKALESSMANNEYLFAVQFHVYTQGKLTELPAKLDYDLRFPTTLRSSSNRHIPVVWETETFFVRDVLFDNDTYTGVPPGYMEEGFIQLQHAIAMSFIELKSKATLPHIQMNKFPAGRSIEDPYRIQMKILLSLAILFAYIYPSYSTVQAITDEEERGIMNMLNIKIKNWCAWMVILFILQSLTTVLILIAVQLSWADFTILTYNHLWPIFCFLLCYVCASSSFILAISIVFIHRRCNSKYALTMRIFTLFPLPFLLNLNWGLGYKLLGCLSLDTALAMGISIIIDFEASGQTIKWANFLEPHFAGDNFNLIHATIMLLLDSILYMIALFYYHYKCPPEITIVPTIDKEAKGKHWYYPLEFLLCSKYRRSILKDMGMFLLHSLTVHEDDLVDNFPSFRPSELNNKGTQTNQRHGRSNKGTMPFNRLTCTSSRGSSETSLIVKKEKNFRKHRKSEIISHPSESSTSFDVPPSRSQSKMDSWPSMSGVTIPSRSLSESSFESKDSTDLVVNPPLINPKNGIQVIQVSKTIGYVNYLDDISMNIHPKEITIILSKEKESRLFLSHIIAGIVSPTSGKVLINNEDVATYNGTDTLCCILPQESIIFNQLSTTENLYFYMHLKGMRNYRQISREIEKYLDQLDMSIEDAEELANELSVGRARCLSLCCALCGGKHAVIVDNPTEGLNQMNRYHMWDLLKTAALTRIIIVNTIYSDEAETLGNRISVLHNGRLQCYDYAKNLRDRYFHTYTLHCEIVDIDKTDKNYNNLYALLIKYFPSDVRAQYLPNLNKFEVEFNMERERQLVEFLVLLEEKKEYFGFGNFWFRRHTLRDVFITQEQYLKFPNEDTMDELVGILNTSEDGRKSFEHFYQQFVASMKAKIILLKRLFWIVILVLLMLPFSVLLNLQTTNFRDLSRLNMSFESYIDTIVLMRNNLKLDSTMLNYDISKTYKTYNKLLKKQYESDSHKLIVVSGRREIKPYFLYLDVLSILACKSFYLAAADFHPDKIIIFWNNHVKHSAPISLNMLHNTLAIHFIGPNSEIKVANHPLHHGNSSILNMEIHQGLYIGIGYGVILVMCIIMSLIGLPLTWDRISGNMHLKLQFEKTVAVYWTSNIIIDGIIYLVIVFYLMSLLIIHDNVINHDSRNYEDVELLIAATIVLIFFGMASLPFVYVLGKLFESVILAFACTLSVLVCSSIGVLMTFNLQAGLRSNASRRLCIWSPSLILYKAMRKVHITAALKRTCREVHGCRNQNFCCFLKGYYSYDYPGIFNEIVVFICQSILYMTIVIYLYRNPLFFNNFRFTKPKPLRRSRSSMNENTLREKNLVRDIHGENLRNMALVVKGLKNSTNLKENWFFVEPGQVFGLIGPELSGKTTMLKYIIGEKRIEYGKVYVAGVNVTRNLTQSKKHIAYCPSRNTLLEFMTVKEILQFYCHLGCRKPSLIRHTVETICRFLDLNSLMNRRIDKLSYCDKRKITLVTTFLSSKNILVLDNPTKGMDPDDKAQMWLLIEILKLCGRTIILTTNDIDEAILLCDKIGVMSKGYIQNIGSVTDLISQNSLGHTIEIVRARVIYSKHPNDIIPRDSYIKVVDTSYWSDVTTDSEEYTLENSVVITDSSIANSNDYNREWVKKASKYRNIVQFMSEELSFATLQESYCNFLVYFIPFQSMALSTIFKAMYAAKKVLDVHSFKVTRKYLEEIYDTKARQEGG